MSEDKAGCATCGGGVRAWDEADHPRGQPDNAGQFGPGGGGGDSKPSGGKGGGNKGKDKGSKHPGKGYSKSCWEDDKGVIHCAEVEDAFKALNENRKVELNQPRGVSVLLKKIGEVTKDMIGKGQKAPNYNLCNVSVSGTNLFCVESKGIPRIQMPQLDDKQTADFEKLLSEKYSTKHEEQFASYLRATQNELNGVKVAGVAEYLRIKQPDSGPARRIIVSKDDYILDGHHSWAAKIGLDAEDNNLTNDTKMPIIRVDITITQLLEEAEKFTGGKGKRGGDESAGGEGAKKKSIKDVVVGWVERIERVKMPQLNAQQTKAFRKALKKHAYNVTKEIVPANTLHATQNSGEHDGHGRLVISSDNYVLDGTVKGDLSVRVARVDVPLRQLLKLAGKGTKAGKSAGQIVGELYRATFGDEELEFWIEHFEQQQVERQRKWEAARAEAERLLRGDYIQLPSGKLDGSLPGPGHGGGGGGDGGSGSGGKDGGDKGGKASSGKTNYGLVKGDEEKYHALRAEWSKLNNIMLDEDLIDHPDGPEATKITFQMQALVKEMQALKADPGGPGGIGLPGGPRDVAIIGAGPGGLWAGINAGAEGLDALLIEGASEVGGQAKFSSRVENYGGFPVGARGDKLMENLHLQSQRMGTESLLGVRVTDLKADEKTGLKTLTLSNGEKIEARSVILSGGLFFRDLPPFPGKEGPGVIIGDNKKLQAAVKEVGPNGSVCVIGGSNGAGQAALSAAKHCKEVYVLARSGIEDMSPYVISGLRNHPKVTVIENDQIAELFRNEHGTPVSMITKNGMTVPVNAIGAWVGGLPDTKWMSGTDIQLDPGNKVKVFETATTAEKVAFEEKYGRAPDRLETMIPGVYVAGDVRVGGAGRVGEAAGDGQHALRAAYAVLFEQRKAFRDAQKKKAAEPAKPAKPKKEKDTAALDKLIDELFDLDRENPWWGQTIEGTGPLEPNPKPKSKKKALA